MMPTAAIHYLQLIRAPAVFTAISNIFAAHIILSPGEINWPVLLLLISVSALLYSAGMALNDWFDYRLDLREKPSRPLPSGKIQRSHALWLSTLLLISAVGLASLAGALSFYLSLGIVLLILLYDGLLKQTAIGSVIMGGCRYANWLLGFSFLALTTQTLLIPLPVLIYIAALTLLSQQEESAKNNIVVVISAAGILLAGFAILGISALQESLSGWEVLLVGLATGYMLFRLWRCYHDFNVTHIQATIKLMILAIIPLDALLVMVFAPSWWVLAVLALMIPGKLLARRMYIT